jgi:hypothetical protein
MASLSVLLSPGGGAATISAPISLSVTGLPDGATYTFSPTAIASGSAATAVSLSVQLPANSASSHSASPLGRVVAPLELALLLLPFAAFMRKAGRGFRGLSVFLLAACLIGAAALSGCTSVTTPQTYTVLVTGVETGPAGTISRSAIVTLMVE